MILLLAYIEPIQQTLSNLANLTKYGEAFVGFLNLPNILGFTSTMVYHLKDE